MVGGGPGTATNGGYGAEIDSADVVVRVNRVPPPDHSYAGVLGRRTDVLFKDECHPEQDGGTNVRQAGQNPQGTRCVLRLDNCPFDAIVFRGNTAISETGCSGENQNNDKLVRSGLISSRYYGIVNERVTNVIYGLRGYQGGNNGHKPTSGLHAAVAFALECGSLRLYGFAGDVSLDGHEIMASHGISEEHVLLNTLANLSGRSIGSSALGEMTQNAELRTAWEGTNMTIVC